VIQILTLLLTIALSQAGPTASDTEQEAAKTSAPARAQASTNSACESTGKTEIKIDCEYPVSNDKTTGRQDQPRIVLNHAVIKFAPKHESHMMIDLTFTNESGVAFAGSRTVYIAFDDETGQNHIRRPLPHVDFQRLVSREPTTFSDHFLAPALQPGRYFVRLWIPDPSPALKFNAAHNFLLSNAGMAEVSSGLDQIATIFVEKANMSSRSDDR
jgi:hypothetical protein